MGGTVVMVDTGVLAAEMPPTKTLCFQTGLAREVRVRKRRNIGIDTSERP